MLTPTDSKQSVCTQQTPDQPQIMHKTVESFMEGSSPQSNKIEERLINYAKVYEGRRTSKQQDKIRKEREPSKEKPDINQSSEAIVEQKKLKIFEQLFIMLNPTNDIFIDPSTADYKSISIQVIDILMDVFTQFEEELKPWDKPTFIKRCNEAYQKMPQGDKSDLLKLFNKAQREDSATRHKFKPETNQKSAQICMSNRQFGVSAYDQLYKQHSTISQKKDKLREDMMQELMKKCPFRPKTNEIQRRKSGMTDRRIL